MSDKELHVSDNLVVSLDYALRLDDGEEIDRSDSQEPLQFLQGQGQIISGLEQALYGMQVNDEKDIVVSPTDGYGEYDPDNIEAMPRNAFPEDLALEEGMGLNLRDSETNEVIEVSVFKVRDDKVLLDFNHPLAGETLHFSVKIAGLRQATAEELDHGHVHVHGHEH